MKDTIIELSKPIDAHGETLSQLRLQEPTLGVLDDVELFSIKPDGTIKINLGDIHKVIAGMGKIPPSAAREIALSDLKLFLPVVMDFFGDALPIGET